MRPVHAPNRKIQQAREADPGKIGQQQKRRVLIQRTENQYRGQDRQPQQDDIHQSEIGTPQAEETGRPGRVDQKTDAINTQRKRCAGETSLSPHKPSRHRDGKIKNAPSGREQPVGRVPPGLCQPLVPFAGTEERAGTRRYEADGQKAAKAEYRSLVHGYGTSIVARRRTGRQTAQHDNRQTFGFL